MHTMHLQRLSSLCLVLALAGCGGGSDAPAPAPTPTPAPAPVPGSNRIEPYDPGPLQKLAPSNMADLPLVSVVPDATITLALLPPPLAKAGETQQAGTPLQIGIGRSIAATADEASTAALLQWQPAERGMQQAALRFHADAAQGLRLGLAVRALPDASQLLVQGAQGQAQRIDTALLQAATPLVWSPEVAGEEVTLVIRVPAQASPLQVRLAVPRLSQTTVAPDQAPTLAKAGAGSCEVSVACSQDYIEQGRSVARLRFVETNGNAFQCSGTLMNDMASSGTPYLLTARHCIADQAAAATLTTDWLLRASACGSSTPTAERAQRTGGATVLYTNPGTDTTLLRLNDMPPVGVVYAGSYFGANVIAGTAISDVHHPEGDLQRVSLGTVTGYSNCTSNLCVNEDRSLARFYSVRWQQGVVEPGSSGSGAFTAIGARRYLVGQLFGGTSSCSAPNGTDYFARFDVNYANGLQSWLNP